MYGAGVQKINKFKIFLKVCTVMECKKAKNDKKMHFFLKFCGFCTLVRQMRNSSD